MTNREKIGSMAMFDLLSRINDKFMEGDASCVLEMIEGDGVECLAEGCDDCIMKWLNEEATAK